MPLAGGPGRGRTQRMGAVLAVLAAWLALVPAPGAADTGAPDQRAGSPGGDARLLVSASGLRVGEDGRSTRIDLTVAIGADEDPAAVASAALRRWDAKPMTQARAAGVSREPVLRWPQLFDRDRTNDFVVQVYNPVDDPTGASGDVEAVIARVHATWNAVGTATFRLRYDGHTAARAALDGVNTIEWAAGLLCFCELAVTITHYEAATGVILDSDVLLNAHDWEWSAALEPPGSCDGNDSPPPEGDEASCMPAIDLETTLAHENGHVAGLDHSLDPAALMYAFLAPGETRRSLAGDDVAAISERYPLKFRPIHPLPREPERPARPLAAARGVAVVSELGLQDSDGFWFENDFEPYGLSGRSIAAFVTDVFDFETWTMGEGAYLASGRDLVTLARTGSPAPGGGTFGPVLWEGIGLNGAGDAAFTFQLEPLARPFGVNAGVYRHSATTRTLSPVVIPGVTPAPAGGVFHGAFTRTTLSDTGDVVFAGIVRTDTPVEGEDFGGLGMGIYRATAGGPIVAVVAPGDPAPGGGVFDFADRPHVNASGDIAFRGHVRGNECVRGPRRVAIGCDGGVYVWRARTSLIEALVPQGHAAPDGRNVRGAYPAGINNRGDVLVVADLTGAPLRRLDEGVFVHAEGKLQTVSDPGREVPGGGAPIKIMGAAMNNAGDVVVTALLDVDADRDERLDFGLFVWQHGTLSGVLRSGQQLGDLWDPLPNEPQAIPNPTVVWLDPLVAINDRGRVLIPTVLQWRLDPSYDWVTGNLFLLTVDTR